MMMSPDHTTEVSASGQREDVNMFSPNAAIHASDTENEQEESSDGDGGGGGGGGDRTQLEEKLSVLLP
jgi:hypothetical protein